jgi:hypothetical protein
LESKTFASISQQNQFIGCLKLFAKYILNKKDVHLSKIERPKSEKKLPRVIDKDFLWDMANRKSNILELLSMVELAEGNVYVAGLGLGLITLLIANKSNVNKVVVSEKNEEVIDFFNGQGFDTTKIAIFNEAWENHKGTDAYDYVMLDHYDDLDIEKIKIEFRKFKVNNSGALKIDFFKWHHNHKLAHLSVEQLKRYKHDVFAEDFDCGFIVDALKRIHARRTRTT